MEKTKYNFKKIEQKWQKKWEESKVFRAKEGKKKKFYSLEMYPYPSSSGLHMGHAFNYVLGDIYARFKRMQGFNVLHPMGYDSFGLPAENAAIKEGVHPRTFTDSAIKNFIQQQKMLGLSYDWERMLMSHDANYYKWNQWFFIKMYEKGLAYRKKAPVNWCPKCQTVLANEQVHNGKCWRHDDTEVEIRNLEQWFLKITDYAEELLREIDGLDWPERIKIMQRNWIGRSEGADIDFEINGKKWPVFTIRPDTLFGVTFMVVSAQHPELMGLVTEQQKKEAQRFLKKIKSTKQGDIDKLEKEGVFTGSYAINPISREKIPVYAGNFVVAEYGSGMVMGVPAHDQRDFEFAKKYKLPIRQVVSGENIREKAFEGFGTLINSGNFNGLSSDEAMEHITKALGFKKLGRKKIQYKMRDWLVSRQRYWGTPIPMLYDEYGNVFPIDESDLPIRLPDDIKFGKGNPLETSKTFINIRKNGKNYRRETDTMDTFFDSSWYFLRFTDPKNKKAAFDRKKVDYWLPVDFYTGGAEHAVMHLLYARFFTKVLRDLGMVSKSLSEPFKRLFNQGMLHGPDGFVMSKSRGNVVLPEEVSERYGIDTARFFLISVASPDKDTQWSENGIDGSLKFISKVMDYFSDIKFEKTNARIESKLNKTIKEVTSYIENLQYNLATIKIRELFSHMERGADKKTAENFLKLLSPFCPHITEEIWHNLGNKGFVSLEKWPVADERKINEQFEKEEKLIDDVVNDINNVVNIVKNKGKNVSKLYIYVLPNELGTYVNNLDLIAKRTNLDTKIYSVADKAKHDPENKSKKVKPGRPGIYLE
ncbi:MAG: leucine--tRNA ligase [Nanoarchaeota archaeon]|nr:leucine--tRNA ligase [Nanoarchaeota archaeon]